MESMATSMAEHLRRQEYSRLRRSGKSLLGEPPVSDDAAELLLEAYDREDSFSEEYLAYVKSQRPFTPDPTSHAVVIDTGTYCANVPLPVVVNSFLKDHGNKIVKATLSHCEVGMLEKLPSGGILVHVRTAEAESHLIGQEVN
ncbi:unnamed protein product [Phytophthora lilii]|uniref:Unnamed protein product n=1 Tax=Phytophthora lilii TaxID=2077276 RepID=A0A9W6X5V6_9STRA|nr:unnamed protein product [Phytophthora lilii]